MPSHRCRVCLLRGLKSRSESLARPSLPRTCWIGTVRTVVADLACTLQLTSTSFSSSRLADRPDSQHKSLPRRPRLKGAMVQTAGSTSMSVANVTLACSSKLLNKVESYLKVIWQV